MLRDLEATVLPVNQESVRLQIELLDRAVSHAARATARPRPGPRRGPAGARRCLGGARATPRPEREVTTVDVQTGLVSLLVVSVVSALAPFISALLQPHPAAPGRGAHRRRRHRRAGGARPGSTRRASSSSPTSAWASCSSSPATSWTSQLFRERVGRLAVIGWFVTAVLAIAGHRRCWRTSGSSTPSSRWPLGLTTTAFGALLPILRDNDMLGGRFGRYILPAGAVGEFLPIVGIAVFLGANGRFLGLVSLVAMFAGGRCCSASCPGCRSWRGSRRSPLPARTRRRRRPSG